MNIEVDVDGIGFFYNGWFISPYEDWISLEDQTNTMWWSAEKQVANTWHWRKRMSLKDLIVELNDTDARGEYE